MLEHSHGPDHIRAVVRNARMLAMKYASQYLRLAAIAAELHDVTKNDYGTKEEDDHEITGAELVRTGKLYTTLRRELTEEELTIVVEAIREHRASTGNPKHIVAKIVSDADRIGTLHRKWPMRRAVLYRVERGGNPQDDALILGAARHLEDKFRPPKGYGLRTFFAETAEILAGTYAPVWPALDSNNVARLRRLAGPL